MWIHYLILLSITSIYCFHDQDTEIISTIMEFLGIKQCMLVTMMKDLQISSNVKYFSRKNVLVVYFDFTRMINYFKNKSFVFSNLRTMIVLKVRDDAELLYMLKEIQLKVSYDEDFGRFTWMMLLPENAKEINEDNFHVPFNCEFFLVKETNSGYAIEEIYQIKNGSNMAHSNFGHYYGGNDFELKESYVYNRRNNFQGEMMIMETPDKGACRLVVECLHDELWHDMGNVLNFSTIYVKTEQIFQNLSIKPDLGSEISQFHSVIPDIHHRLGPILQSLVHMYIRNPGKDRVWTLYFKPFDRKLWWAIFTWIAVSGFIFILTGWLATKLLAEKGYSLIDHGLIPLSEFCSQSNYQNPHNISTRIAKISAFIAAGIIVPAYSAFIISFLTIDKPKIPFHDFESFVADGTYKLALMRTNFTFWYFKEGDDPVVVKIRNYLIDFDNFPYYHEEAIDMLCTTDKLAVINYNYKMLQRWSPCEILIVSNNIMTIGSSIKLENDGVYYRKLMLDLLIKFRAAGVISRAQKRLFGKTDFKIAKDLAIVDIDTTMSLLVMLLAGLIISIIFFLLELLSYHLGSGAKCSNLKEQNLYWQTYRHEFTTPSQK